MTAAWRWVFMCLSPSFRPGKGRGWLEVAGPSLKGEQVAVLRFQRAFTYRYIVIARGSSILHPCYNDYKSSCEYYLWDIIGVLCTIGDLSPDAHKTPHGIGPDHANFLELCQGEVLRIYIPRTLVNRGKKKP